MNKNELKLFLFQFKTPLFHSKTKPNISIVKKENKIKRPKNFVIVMEYDIAYKKTISISKITNNMAII